MGNVNHDERGRFSSGSSSGAATGDHLAVSPSLNTRNVEGHGNVPRSRVIVRHIGAGPSLGTENPKPRFIATAGGLKPKVMSRGLSAAAAERVALNASVDASLYHKSNPNRTAATDLARPQAGFSSTLGRFKYPRK
jgi:hypothetical protein